MHMHLFHRRTRLLRASHIQDYLNVLRRFRRNSETFRNENFSEASQTRQCSDVKFWCRNVCNYACVSLEMLSRRLTSEALLNNTNV